MSFAKELQSLETSAKKLREFGFVVGGIFCLLSGFLFWRENAHAAIFLWPGVPLIILGAALPRILKYPYLAWMGLALVMGAIVSRILLTILFFLAVTPIGIITRLMGKRFLDLSFDRSQKTYWIKKQKPECVKTAAERQF